MKTLELHLITVGISLLSNFARDTGCTLEETVRRGSQLEEYLKSDPQRASAELAGFLGLLGSKARLPNVSVALIHSQTAEGKLAATHLRKWLAAHGVKVTTIQLSNVDLPANAKGDIEACQRAAETGLRELRDKLVSHIQKVRAQVPAIKVLVNATGGYKAQIAVAYSVGKLLDARTYYQHETYRTPVFLP